MRLNTLGLEPEFVADEAETDLRSPQHRRKQDVSQLKPYSPPASPTEWRHLDVQPQYQERTNACGTASLAAVMTYWGRPTRFQDIDASIRHFNLFTAPDAIVAYAQAQGMRAQLKAGASLEDVAHLVDQGVPPIVLIDAGRSDDLGLHYVTVCGYRRDEQGRITEVMVADSATGHHTVKADVFEAKWSHLRLNNIDTGLHRVMISVLPRGGQPIRGGDGRTRSGSSIRLPTRDLVAEMRSLVARKVANVVSAVTSAADTIWNGIQAVGRFLGSLFK